RHPTSDCKTPLRSLGAHCIEHRLSLSKFYDKRSRLCGFFATKGMIVCCKYAKGDWHLSILQGESGSADKIRSS
ncbi:MAG: hypothetical protein PHS51_04035, partial [Gallionella sp.]|nr:hypothetical protein [Gallionella sp.]